MLRHVRSVAWIIIAIGCNRGATTAARAGGEVRTAPADTAWFTRSLVRDLNGDGVSDTLALRAYGRRGDSLSIAFTITSGGREVFRERWTSRYELIDPPLPEHPSSEAVDSLIRARLEAEFGAVHVESADSSLLTGTWTPGDYACQGSAVDCIAWVERYRQAGDPLPGEDPAAHYRRIRSMPVDSAEVEAIVADIRANATSQITVSYGYETTTTIMWSGRVRRFVTVASCC